MPPPRSRSIAGPLTASALLGTVLLGAVLLVACDDGDDAPAPQTTPTAQATVPLEATAPESARTPAPDATPPGEVGLDPVFWRTVDGLQGVRADEPYKIVLRVTSGYDEPALTVVATLEETGAEVEFEAVRVEPQGPEDPGSFYAFNLDLPEPGLWMVTAKAGAAESTQRVEVAPSG